MRVLYSVRRRFTVLVWESGQDPLRLGPLTIASVSSIDRVSSHSPSAETPRASTHFTDRSMNSDADPTATPGLVSLHLPAIVDTHAGILGLGGEPDFDFIMGHRTEGRSGASVGDRVSQKVFDLLRKIGNLHGWRRVPSGGGMVDVNQMRLEGKCGCPERGTIDRAQFCTAAGSARMVGHCSRQDTAVCEQ